MKKLFIKLYEYIWPPKWTQEYMPPNEKKQTQEVKCFKNGKYSHSVIFHYFTEEQIKQLK